MIVPPGYEPHPEGGWFRETWRSEQLVNTPRGVRSSATAISFLLAPGQRSQWHRVRGAGELWLWSEGGLLRLTLGGAGAQPAEPRTVVLGPGDQHLVHPNEWQSAEPVDGPVTCTCVVSPGFDYADFELWHQTHVAAAPPRVATSWTSPLEPLRALEPDRPLSVLLVCEANMCRSPLAQSLLARRLDERGLHEVRLSSAGLRTEEGVPMDPAAVRSLRRHDVTADPAFRSRRFTADLADADLVLTSTMRQRDELVRRAPQARDRTFAWRELAALLTFGPLPVSGQPTAAGRLEEALAQIRGRRGLVRPEAAGGYDVPDPIGKPSRAFDKIADDIATSMGSVAGLLTAAVRNRAAAPVPAESSAARGRRRTG